MAKRVYFGFDYEDVSDFRANVVRKHNFTGGVQKAGYFDASIWEESKKQDPATLKRLINAELENTSTTAILVGSGTWARRWVRYEIIKSIERGNKIFGIHINGIKGKDQLTKSLGADPFEYLALSVSQDGKNVTPLEYVDGKWINFKDHGAFSIGQLPAAERGKALKLSHWLPVYDWAKGDGYNNFQTWIS